MRAYIENVITQEEAKSILHLKDDLSALYENPVVLRVKDIIEKKVGLIDWEPPTYMRVEENGKHDWHIDTGYKPPGHMKWCEYGCSILLNEDKDSGFLEYRDDIKLNNYLGLAIHSSDVEHRISPYKGIRETFLVFVKKKNKKEGE